MVVCPTLPLVDNIVGAGHCIRLGFMASTVQGWCVCVHNSVGGDTAEHSEANNLHDSSLMLSYHSCNTSIK